MRILAFDTALRACSAAVLCVEGDERKLARAYEARERGHAETLMPMIEQLMREAGIFYRDLDRIAVTIGPGTFTGTRVGIAAARGLGLAVAIPVIGETSLAVMANSVQARPEIEDQPLAIAVDARRGQIYFQHFGAQPGTRGAPVVLTPEDAAALLPQETSLAAGSGAAALAQAAGGLGRKVEAILPDLQPDAAALAEMARTRTPGAEPVRPLYLRPPDAKPQAMSTIAIQQ